MTSPTSRSRLRSDSASSTGSRNDLFSTTYSSGPVPRPPKPLNVDTLPSAVASGGVGIGSGNWATSMRDTIGKIGISVPTPQRSRISGDESPASTRVESSRTTSPTRGASPYTSDFPTSKTANFFSSTMGTPQPPSSGKNTSGTDLRRLAPAPILTSRGMNSTCSDDSGMALQSASGTRQNVISPISPISPIRLSPITPPPIPSSSKEVEVDTSDVSSRRSTLGTGRYARVVRARCRCRDNNERSRVTGGHGLEKPFRNITEHEWKDCALKVPLFNDVLSRGMLEKEARILAHLHELSVPPQRHPSLEGDPDTNKPEGYPKTGKNRIIGYIGLQQISGFTSGSRKGKTSAHGSPIIRTTRSEARHYRSVSDIAAPRTMASHFQDGQHPDSPYAAQISLNDDEESISLPCLILEYVPRALSAWLEDGNRRLMGQELWRSWAAELAEALQWCHEKGVLHGDMKPGNVLVSQWALPKHAHLPDLPDNFQIDNQDRLRLVDFGSSLMLSSVAKPPSASPFPTPTMLCLRSSSPNLLSFDLGTAPYSAPELFSDTAIVSFPSDIFSLGVTLWQLLTFRTPYAGKRTVETMLGVRRGMFWEIHERDRIARIIGGERAMTKPDTAAGVRRAGSLRIPGRERLHKEQLLNDLHRMSSRSSENLTKLPLLIEQRLVEQTGKDRVPEIDSARTYDDGAPAMCYPDEKDIVDEETRSLLRSMVDPTAEVRPTAREVLAMLCN